MTDAQFLTMLIAPIGALVIAAVALYATREDRKKHRTHPGE